MGKPRLRRSLGVIDATGIALGAIIGAGIFVTIGQAASIAGSAFLLALPIGALVAMLSGFSAIELGIRFPRAGGAYEFAREVVSPLVGFIAGWVYLLAGTTANSTFVLAFTGYLNSLVPGLSPKLVAAVLIIFATAFNYFGIRTSVIANAVLVSIKVIILVAFILMGIPAVKTSNFQPFDVTDVGALFRTSALMFFAYAGFARPVTLAEEVERPAYTLPKSLITALVIASLLYFATSSVAIGVAGSSGLARSPAPLGLAAAIVASELGRIVVSAGALMAIASVFLAEVLALSRVIFAMARAGDLPVWLSAIHPRYKVPHRAIVVIGIVVLVLSLYMNLGFVIAASSMAVLIYYGILNFSAIRLKEKRIYNIYLSVAGLVTTLVLALALPVETILTNAVVILAGFFYYYVVRPRIS